MTLMQLTWPVPRHFESVRGLVLRFAWVNGFASLRALAALLSQVAGVAVANATDITRSPDALRAMSQLAGLDGDELASQAWTDHPSAEGEYLRFHGLLLPCDALLLDRLKVCPACLAEEPYVRADWDLSHVVACSRHSSLLTECCRSCGTQISADSPFTGHCVSCGSAYEHCAPAPASEAAVTASEDAAGLGPISFELGDGRYVTRPEEFFELCRFFAKSEIEFWTDRPRKVRFSALKFDDRVRALDAIGACRTWNGYSVERVRSAIQEHFAHLSSFDDFGARTGRLLQSLGAGQLSIDLRDFILRLPSEQGQLSAASALEGRTKGYTSPRHVAQLLGITTAGVAWLKRNGKLSDPLDELGYSTYELLACEKVLQTLVPCSRFDLALGATGLGVELGRLAILEVWTLSPCSEPSLTLSSIVRLLDALRVASQSAMATTIPGAEGEPAIDGCYSPTWPAYMHARCIVGLLGGTVRGFGWEPPWRLQDLRVADCDIMRLAD